MLYTNIQFFHLNSEAKGEIWHKIIPHDCSNMLLVNSRSEILISLVFLFDKHKSMNTDSTFTWPSNVKMESHPHCCVTYFRYTLLSWLSHRQYINHIWSQWNSYLQPNSMYVLWPTGGSLYQEIQDNSPLGQSACMAVSSEVCLVSIYCLQHPAVLWVSLAM